MSTKERPLTICNARFLTTDRPCRIIFTDDDGPDSRGRRRFTLEWTRDGVFRAQCFFARPENHIAYI